MSRAVGTGLFTSALLFAAFMGAAFLHPEEYRATALLSLDYGDTDIAARAAANPLESVRILRSATLTADFQSELSRTFKPLEVLPSIGSADGTHFVISAQYGDRAGVKTLCSRVAERAAAHAGALHGHWADARDAAAALRQVENIAQFVQKNPAVLSSATRTEQTAAFRAVLREAARSSPGAGKDAPSPKIRLQPAVVAPMPVGGDDRRVLLLVGLIASAATGIAVGLARHAMGARGTRTSAFQSDSDAPASSRPDTDRPDADDGVRPASRNPLEHSVAPPQPVAPAVIKTPVVNITSAVAPSGAPTAPPPNRVANDARPEPAAVPSAQAASSEASTSIAAQRVVTILPPPLAVGAAPPSQSEDSRPAPETARLVSPPEEPPEAEYVVSELQTVPRAASVPSFPVMRTTRALGSPVPSADPTPLPEVDQRRTAKLGSPVPPTEVEARRTGALGTPIPGGSGRYSYVRTPYPAPLVPIRQKDFTAGFHPDESLRPNACAPLRRELYALGVQQCFVVGVTCAPQHREKKARFSAELALLLAQPGHARVLFVEADLERPSAHRLLRLTMPEGESLSEQLYGATEARDVEGWTVLRCMRSLHVLLEGERSSPGLNLSKRFAELVRDVRVHYDFVVLDGPPGDAQEDARALSALVDGVFVVNSAGADANVAGIAELFAGKRLVKAVRAA